MKHYKARVSEIVERVTKELGIPMTPIAQREFTRRVKEELDLLTKDLEQDPEQVKRCLVTKCHQCNAEIELDFHSNVWSKIK